MLLSFAAANRDPEAFERADEVVIDREINRHVAFGVGIHRCAGSNLARMELQVAVEQWLARIPEFRLADGATVTGPAVRCAARAASPSCSEGERSPLGLSLAGANLPRRRVAHRLQHDASLGMWLLGALAYYVGDRIVDRHGGDDRVDVDGDDARNGSGAAMFLGALLDGLPEAFILGVGIALGGGISVAFVVAVFVSNVPQGTAGTISLREAGTSDRTIAMMWGSLTAACAVAAAAGYLLGDQIPHNGVYAQAFAAGAVLVMLADSMMPEAFEHGGAVGRPADRGRLLRCCRPHRRRLRPPGDARGTSRSALGERAESPVADGDGELHPRAQPRLAIDPREVDLDRLRAETHAVGDLAVREPVGDEADELTLDRAELLEAAVLCGTRWPMRRSSRATARWRRTAPTAPSSR